MNQANLNHEDIFPPNFREGPDEQSKKECEVLLTDIEFLESLKTMPFKNVRIKPYIFSLCAEALGNAVRKDENIRDINQEQAPLY